MNKYVVLKEAVSSDLPDGTSCYVSLGEIEASGAETAVRRADLGAKTGAYVAVLVQRFRIMRYKPQEVVKLVLEQD